MKCCICGKDFEGTGVIANPLCRKDDYKSKCCEDCGDFVNTAGRLRGSNVIDNREPMEGDKLVLFWVSDTAGEEKIVNQLLTDGMFVSGKVERVDMELSGLDMIYYGSWGGFPVKTSDSWVNFGND